MNTKLKVGYLLSYDYTYIFTSLKEVYKHADEIVICYDINKKTWSGNTFVIPEEVFHKIKMFDIDNKIKFYGDNFYVPDSPPLDSETRQRNMLAKFMGEGGWHMQIDTDEYPYDFEKLKDFLNRHQFLLKRPTKTPVTFRVKLIVLFKKDNDGFFVITPFDELCYSVTNVPEYEKARSAKKSKLYDLDYYVIHQSWARESEEIQQKIKNWGHKNDFDVDQFYKLWDQLDINNYKSFIDFHPLPDCSWEKLDFIKADSVEDLIELISIKHPQKRIDIPFNKKIKLYLKSVL